MSEYETIKPTEFTAQPIQQQNLSVEKPQIAQQQKKKKSSKVNKIILAVVVVCIVLLVISGVYYAFFVKSKDDEIETSNKMRVNNQQHPISQPQKSSSRDDKILSEMTKKKLQSVMPTTSAVEKAKNAEEKLFTIVEEPTNLEMEEDFKANEQQNILIREALNAENDIEYPLEEPEELEELEKPEESEEDCVVIDIKPIACDFTLSSGKRAGQPCGRRCKEGTRCTNHVSK